MERSAAGEKLCRRRRGISEEGKRARWHGTYVYLRGGEGRWGEASTAEYSDGHDLGAYTEIRHAL